MSMLMFNGILGVGMIGGYGGYVSLDRFVLRFTRVSCGVGGAIWVTNLEIHKGSTTHAH